MWIQTIKKELQFVSVLPWTKKKQNILLNYIILLILIKSHCYDLSRSIIVSKIVTGHSIFMTESFNRFAKLDWDDRMLEYFVLMRAAASHQHIYNLCYNRHSILTGGRGTLLCIWEETNHVEYCYQLILIGFLSISSTSEIVLT